MAPFSVTEALETIACPACAMTFAVPTAFEKKRRSDHGSFYCPAGHPMSFSSESTEEKLRRERDRLKQDAARLEDEKREAWATANAQLDRAKKLEAANKRLKKRTSAGTCPCCQRTFSNMAEHMKHQHPQFVADGGAAVVPIKRSAR